MAINSLFFLLQLIVVYSQPEGKSYHLSRKLVKPGNITIAGLFPIHVRGCETKNFRAKYLALSQAMVFAVNRINNDPSLLPNTTLGYEVYDYCLEESRAMEASLEIVNRRKIGVLFDKHSSSNICVSNTADLNQVPVMIGTGTSKDAIPVANLLQVEDIPLISYAATSDELSKKSYPTFLRTVPPDRFSSHAMADIAEYFNWTFIAAIAANDAYGRSGIEYLKKLTASKGICLAMERYFIDEKNESRQEVSRIITELNSLRNVKVVVLYCTKQQATLLLEEASRQNLSKRTWIASEGWVAREVLTPTILPVIQGLIGIGYPHVLYDGFVDYLTNLTSAYRPIHWWDELWETLFSCKFNSSSSRPGKLCTSNLRITKEIYTSRMHTSMSAYVINAVYAIAHALESMNKCQGPHGPVNSSGCGSYGVIPNELLAKLKTVNFTSPVSHVSFDENGDPTGSYSIKNLQKRDGSWVFHPIGSWDSQTSPHLNIDDDIIMWNGDVKGQVPRSVCQEVCRPGYWQTPRVGCCWQCIECSLDEISVTYGALNCSKCPRDYISNSNHTRCLEVPIVHITYHDVFGLIAMVTCCLGLLGTGFISAVFVRHNDSPIVRASNRELSYMLLFCIAMCYVAPFIYLAKPSHNACILVQVWFYVFYTTCIAILGAKTNKIVMLFEQRTPRSQYTSKFFLYRHVLIVASAMALELVVIVVWVFVDPPQPNVNRTSREQYVHTCKPNVHYTGKVCQYLLMSILIIMSGVCCYFAYKARRLPDNFNEGKFIAFSMYILSISWLTFYPVFLSIQDIYTVVVLSVTTFVSASGLLVCMFWPKVYIILWHPHMNTRHHMQEQISQHTMTIRDRLDSKGQRPSLSALERFRLVIPSIHAAIQRAPTSTPEGNASNRSPDASERNYSSQSSRVTQMFVESQGEPHNTPESSEPDCSKSSNENSHRFHQGTPDSNPQGTHDGANHVATGESLDGLGPVNDLKKRHQWIPQGTPDSNPKGTPRGFLEPLPLIKQSNIN